MLLQKTLFDHPTMIGVVFLKPVGRSIMKVNKLRSHRIVSWLDPGDVLNNHVLEGLYNAAKNDEVTDIMVDVLRPKNIPDRLFPIAKGSYALVKKYLESDEAKANLVTHTFWSNPEEEKGIANLVAHTFLGHPVLDNGGTASKAAVKTAIRAMEKGNVK